MTLGHANAWGRLLYDFFLSSSATPDIRTGVAARQRATGRGQKDRSCCHSAVRVLCTIDMSTDQRDLARCKDSYSLFLASVTLETREPPTSPIASEKRLRSDSLPREQRAVSGACQALPSEQTLAPHRHHATASVGSCCVSPRAPPPPPSRRTARVVARLMRRIAGSRSIGASIGLSVASAAMRA